MSTAIAVLSNKPFRYLWIGQIFSMIATHILAFVLIITVYQQTSSNTAVSMLVLTIGIPSLTLGIFAGVFVDFFHKQRVLFWCNVLRAILVFVLFFLPNKILILYLISTLVAVITQFFVPAEAPLIPNLVPSKQVFMANSLFTFTYYSTMAIGFVSSGPLLAVFGDRISYGIVGVLLLISAVAVYLIPSKKDALHIPINEIYQNLSKEFKRGISYIRQQTGIREAIILFTAFQAIITTLASLAPGFADKILLIELTRATVIIMAPVVAGVMVSALILGSYTPDWLRPYLIDIGVMGSGLVLLLVALFVRLGNSTHIINGMEEVFPSLAVIDRLEMAMFLFFLFGVFNAAVIVPINAYLQENTIEALRGRVYGIISALGGGISILPVMGAGGLADRFGVGKTIFALALAINLLGVYRIFRHRYNE